MLEVEAKVWLTDKEIDPQSVLEVLKKECEVIGHKKKYDWYFAKQGENRPLKDIMDEMFRLRDENGKLIITHKRHRSEGGFEANTETEFEIDDKEAFFRFAKGLGYEVVFEKGKKSQIFQKGNYTFELNEVFPLGFFLEIEKVFQKELCDLQEENKLLEEAFKMFGLSAVDFESRRYIELMQKRG